MKRLNTQKGFTLVELAIVLTIVGLLIGGILKGQALISNARVTAQIAQIQAIDAATTYAGLPGNITNAAARVPNCTAALCAPGAGNDILGGVALAAPAAEVAGEYLMFWNELSSANLISTVVPKTAVDGTWGDGLPANKIRGGLEAEDIGAAGPPTYSGLYLIAMTIQTALPGGAIGNDGNPFTASQAAQMDRKTDDGLPQTGNVIGLGAADCTGATYLENVAAGGSTARDCGLAFGIQH
jgi:prepilin-type N-terminal cleavage/methylation domain-containing protein